jgi:thiol-disulfide isomerase/thioredoxin
VLDQMVTAYKAAASYSDKGQVRITGKFDGETRDEGGSYSVALQRPNRLRVDAFAGIEVVDGEHLWAFSTNLPNQVMRRPAPAELTIGSILGDPILAGAMSQGPTQMFSWVPVQLIVLLADDPLKSLLDGAEEPRLAEPAAIGPNTCDRVVVKRMDGTAVFWIDQASHALRRIELPTDQFQAMFEPGRVRDFAITIELADARLGSPIDPNLLAFQAPPEAQIVENFEPPGVQLLGKPAPEFTFVDLEGDQVTPPSLAGKVAVLDVWATWCGPCRETLPMLETVYQKYKDNPKVAFRAVSVDTPDVSNAALEEAMKGLGVTVPVVRDPDQFALKAFGISGIPSMVVLGADGLVQGFETGVLPGLDEGLPEVLEQLLAGEDIYQRKVENFEQGRARFQRWLQQRVEQDMYAGPLSFEQEPIAAEIAPKSEPTAFKLQPLWSCDKLTEPGNVVVVDRQGGPPEIFAVDAGKSIARIGADGSVAAVHELPLDPGQPIRFLRTTLAADGRRLWVASANGSLELHLLDQDFQPLVTYPESALENRHDGIGDVEFADLDGDGTPEICVGYWGVVGVQGVSLDGKRIWADRSLANALRLAVLAKTPATDGKSRLLSTNETGSLVMLGEGGQRLGEFALPNFFMHWIVAEDLDGDGVQEFCGLSPTETGDFVALGLNLDGKLLWEYPLPPGLHQHAIEPITAGQVFAKGPKSWLVAAADGSIHVIGADGKPIDRFNYGTVLTGLATARIDGQPVLLVATPESLDALRIEKP